MAALGGGAGGCGGGGGSRLVGRPVVRRKAAAQIHPPDISTGLSLECALCEGWGNGGICAQWNNDPLQIYSVRMEFPQSTKLDLPSAALLALSSSGDVELTLDTAYHANLLSGTMAQTQMAGGTPRSLEKEVIAADYAPDGKTLAVVRHANRKVQLEYPAGKVLYTTSGYLDYVRVSPSASRLRFWNTRCTTMIGGGWPL